jgi:hypothetical protein
MLASKLDDLGLLGERLPAAREGFMAAIGSRLSAVQTYGYSKHSQLDKQCVNVWKHGDFTVSMALSLCAIVSSPSCRLNKRQLKSRSLLDKHLK